LVTKVDIFDTGMLAQFGFAQAGFEAAVLPVGRLTVYQQPKAVLKTELFNIGHFYLLFKGAEHSEES
jgi:predicted Zn-dependent protease